jgi:putative spermidine/putrescine transport system permease protein
MSLSPSSIPSRAIADVVTRPDQRSRRAGRLKRGFSLSKVVLILVVLYLVVPLGAALAFGISNGSNLDFSALQRTFSDPDFGQTLLTSLQLALATTVIMIVLVTPTVYWAQLRLPRARPLLEFLSLVPFAMPAIVLSVGLLQEYSGTSGPLINILSLGLVPFLGNTLNIIDTPPLLVCAYVIVALPFVYRAIDNSLRSINTTVLTEAAYSLGSGWWRTFLMVILPNIWPGVISAALLTFSTVMGEFTLASLLNIYSFPIFLNATGQNDPHQAASLSILSFMFTLICVMAIIVLIRFRRAGAGGVGTQVDITGTR